MEPKTRQGQAAWRYLRDHPKAGPSEVAKAIGCKRDTARSHIRAYLAETGAQDVRPDVADAAKAAATKPATPPPVPPGQTGRRFEEDYPVTPPKKPAPAPEPKPEPAPADDDEYDVEW